FFQAEDGIRDRNVTGVQTCALPISLSHVRAFCACAGAAARNGDASAIMASESAALRMMVLPHVDRLGIGSGSNSTQTVNNRRLRSEERRVGKERRSRRSPDRLKRNW